MSDDATPSRDVPADDWQVMRALFSDDGTEFRHHMGLVRADTRAFFAPTQDRAALLAERRSILSSPEANRYVISGPQSAEAFDDFARSVGGLAKNETTSSNSSAPRELGLIMEPDWLLLAAPEWRVVAACVCFPTRWSLEGKTLEKLANIHGIVPRLNEELGRKIETFFSKVKPGEGWGRANWGLSSNARLNQHPALPYESLRDDQSLEQIQVRVEQQHLCKLPLTGTMSFGIRVVNYPLTEVMEHSSIIAGLKQRLRTMPAEIARYKGIPPHLSQRL